MTREEIFAVWAPSESPWSDWVKPAAFAHLPRLFAAINGAETIDLSWAPWTQNRTALVVDLRGAATVRYGLALAALGYRPVPLFNAIPPPMPSECAAVVQIEPILSAITSGAEMLRTTSIEPNAPPAFLIDADRQTIHNSPTSGAFDNRSVVFTTDFPSAARLAKHAIGRVVLIREQADGLGADLAGALRTWHQDGIQLLAKWLDRPGDPIPFTPPPQYWWTRLWNRAVVYLRFRRNAAGEFGEFIPHAAGG